MSDDDEGECKATAKKQNHHAQQTPLVFHREWKVLQKDRSIMKQCKPRKCSTINLITLFIAKQLVLIAQAVLWKT